MIKKSQLKYKKFLVAFKLWVGLFRVFKQLKLNSSGDEIAKRDLMIIVTMWT